MLGIVAAVIFAVAFVISATNTSTSALFAPSTLIAAGLALLALHLSDLASAWAAPRRRFRR